MTKKYVIDEEEVNNLILNYEDWQPPKWYKSNIAVYISNFLKSKQEVELLAEGEVLIDEEDNEIWIGDPDTNGTPMNCEISKHELENIKLYIEVQQ